MNSEEKNKTTIFVDGNCIICDLEVAHYKRKLPEAFKIVDISDPSFDAQKHGLTAEAVNKHMHVQTPDGKIETGVNAFAHIWSRFPQYKWASKVIKMPVINQCAKVGYDIFATVRPWLPKKTRS